MNIEVGDNVVYKNVYGSWSCKVLAIVSENTYKLISAQGQVMLGMHAPENTRKDEIIPFEDEKFMAV